MYIYIYTQICSSKTLMRKRSFQLEVSADVSFDRNHRPWKGNERFFSSKDKKEKENYSPRTSKNYHFGSYSGGFEWFDVATTTIALSLLSGEEKKKKKREKYDGSISVYRIDGNGGNGSSGFRKRSPLYCRRNEIYFELCIFYSLSLNRSYFFYQKNT